MTTKTKSISPWGRLLTLPEAPEEAAPTPPRRRRPSFPNSLEEFSKHFDAYKAVKSIRGPLSLRQALVWGKGQAVSQAGIGRLLAPYAGHTFTRSTVSLWERGERGQRLPAKYAMTAATRDAYRELLGAVVALASKGRLRLRAKMGPRAWSFAVVADCRSCGRPFTLKQSRQVNCPRCKGKSK